MKRFVSMSIGVVLLGFAMPVYAQAGPFIDWIHKLSGPEFDLRWEWLPLNRITLGRQRGLQLSESHVDNILRTVQSARTFVPNACTVSREALDSLKGPGVFRAQLIHRLRGAEKAAAHSIQVLGPPQVPGANQVQADERNKRLTELRGRTCAIRRDVSSLLQDPRAVQQGLIFRFSYLTDGIASDSIIIRSFQLTLEYMLPPLTLTVRGRAVPIYFGAEAGIAWHRFKVTGGRDFTHVSSPIFLNLHPFPGSKFVSPLRIGGGYHIFRPFDAEAFRPVLELEPANVVEVVPAVYVEYDLLALWCSYGSIPIICE